MATDFTQDAVLFFLQSRGGSVKNSDLILHFRAFIREHVDRDRNRELFKKFVNSVATVQQTDGVSYVVLRKKFRGSVPGGGVERGSSGLPLPSNGRSVEPSPGRTNATPAPSRGKPRPKPPQTETTTPAPRGETAAKTVLPAAGIVLSSNNNTETRMNPNQVNNTAEHFRAASAQVVGQVREKAELRAPYLADPPVPSQDIKGDQQRGGSGPVPAVRAHRETNQLVPIPEIPRGKVQVPVQEPLMERVQDPAAATQRVQVPDALSRRAQHNPLRQVGLHPQRSPRHIRHRQSYKTAVNYDDCGEEEDDGDEEEVPVKKGLAGGVLPLNTSLSDVERTVSASNPRITDPPKTSPVLSSSSSEIGLPKIYIQHAERRVQTSRGPGWNFETGMEGQMSTLVPEPGSVLVKSTRQSLPSEAEHFTASSPHATELNHQQDCRHLQPTGVLREPALGSSQNQRLQLSSSCSSVFSSSSDVNLSRSDRPLSPRLSGWSSSEDLWVRAGVPKIQGAPQRVEGMKSEPTMRRADDKITAPWHHSTGNLYDDLESPAHLSPLHRSTDHLHDDQSSAAKVMKWHLSTGDLYDEHEDAESSDSSISSFHLRPASAKRLSIQQKNRMCRSMGADLDQLLHEEETARGGREGNEAARLDRLHRISSSLSLHHMSTSSLSSCSTPLRSQSLASLDKGMEGREWMVKPPTESSPVKQEGRSRHSLVPLEPREHAWLVKGAAGAWPDIYSLFREDSSLLNRKDFISGFTVLHWIAKHGDHRVLNTLWYGVEKAGCTLDINAKSTSGQTPLHVAVIYGRKNIIQLLVKKFKANVKVRDVAGKRPWQYLGRDAPLDMFKLLGAPVQSAMTGQGSVRALDSSWQLQRQRHRVRHHFSSASGERPLTVAGTIKVKRSSSIAAFLKHKSMQRLYGHQSHSAF
ncbi:uncharacterized protein sowahb isoform 1-T1 [Pholidichthys leucotaenia]